MRVALPLALMVVTFYLSAQPFTGPELAWWEVVLRKLGHFSGYAALAASWAWTLHPRLGLSRALRLAALISIGYAISDEYHQSFVEGRHGSPVDVLIDSAGALTALGVVSGVHWRRTSPAPAPSDH